MTELLTSAQMRAIEAAAIDSGSVTGLELMERAGRAVVDAIFEEWPQYRVTSHRAAVLCGPGNNGGDGFVVARLLKEWGWEVHLLLAGEVGALPPDARTNAERWQALGDIRPMGRAALRDLGPQDLYVDAIFGTGLVRPLTGEILDVVTLLSGHAGDAAHFRQRTVAIDAPSGLCLDSGRHIGAVEGEEGGVGGYSVAMTVTFDSPKVGHFLGSGPRVCGKLRVMDIGVAPWREMKAPKRARGRWIGVQRQPRLTLIETQPKVRDGRFGAMGGVRLTAIDKAGRPSAHKYDHGHAVVLSGPGHRTGAARLAARAALRIGAGLVTIGAGRDALPILATHVTSIMLEPVQDGRALLASPLVGKTVRSFCLGPALGMDERAQSLLAAVLGLFRPTVLDADALTMLAEVPGAARAVHGACVLTPHTGEFARLWPDLAEKLQGPRDPGHAGMKESSEIRAQLEAKKAYREALAEERGPLFSKVDAAREAARRAGCVVVLKGADTVIAAPNGRCALSAASYERAAPWLATAGAGDVLAGFIAGLMARGLEPFEAACTAAWIHVECARDFGPGLIAEDLPDAVPAVLRRLGL